MIFICIIVFLILILTLAMLLSVHLKIIYDKKLEIIVKILNFEFKLNSENTKPKKEHKTQKNLLKKNENKKTKKLDFKSALKLIKCLKDILFEFIRLVKLENLTFILKIGDEDKMQTALNYGHACAALYPIFSFINSLRPMNNYNIRVCPDFESQKNFLHMNIQIKIRVFHLLRCAVKGFIKIKNAGDFI